MGKNLELNGMIHAKFRSESAMAKHIGWSKQRLWKITNGQKVPNIDEVNTMAEALGCSVVSLVLILLHNKSPNGEK